MIDAIPAMTTKSKKKSYVFSMAYPINDFLIPASGYKAESIPANLFAVAFAKNQTPINNEANRAGANLFTMDNPIGDKQSSPNVWIK